MRERVNLLNIAVDKIKTEEVIREIFEAIEKGEKKHIVFVNALKVYLVDKDPELKKSIFDADLVLPDGMPIVWISRLFNRQLPERICGTDLFEILLKECENRNKSVYFLGSKDEILKKMLNVINRTNPKLRIAGFRNGYFSDFDDDNIINEINNSKADILFIGISSPKKEIWAYKYKAKINTPVVMGVGGSFDVLAGVVSRAPKWMQKVGLEWFYRVIMEPRRMLGRYLKTNLYFVFVVLKYLINEKFLRKC